MMVILQKKFHRLYSLTPEQVYKIFIFPQG